MASRHDWANSRRARSNETSGCGIGHNDSDGVGPGEFPSDFPTILHSVCTIRTLRLRERGPAGRRSRSTDQWTRRSTGARRARRRPGTRSPTRCSTSSPRATSARPPARSPSGPGSRCVRSTSTSTTSKTSSASPPDRHFARIAPMLTPVAGDRTARRAGARARAPARATCTPRPARSGAPRACTRRSRPRSPASCATPTPAPAPTWSGSSPSSCSALADATQRENIVAVLDVLTGADAWETLRERHDLTSDAAMQCVVDAIVLHLRADRRMTTAFAPTRPRRPLRFGRRPRGRGGRRASPRSASLSQPTSRAISPLGHRSRSCSPRSRRGPRLPRPRRASYPRPAAC